MPISHWIVKAVFASILFPLACVSAYASREPGKPSLPSAPAFSNYAGIPWAVTVVPRVAPKGTFRSIVVTGTCPHSQSVDLVSADTVAISVSADPVCNGGPVPTSLNTLRITAAGTTRVVLRFLGSNDIVSETTMVTTDEVLAASTDNVSGMWFDPATNGSGVSIQHNPANAVLFGTWFMYGASMTRWYSVQKIQRVDTGGTFEGLILEVTGTRSACATTESCPSQFANFSARGVARFKLRSATTAQLIATDLFGNPLFTSELVKLAQ